VTSLHALNIGDAGDTQTLPAHTCPSAFTLGHMSLDKSLDASSISVFEKGPDALTARGVFWGMGRCNVTYHHHHLVYFRP